MRILLQIHFKLFPGNTSRVQQINGGKEGVLSMGKRQPKNLQLAYVWTSGHHSNS